MRKPILFLSTVALVLTASAISFAGTVSGQFKSSKKGLIKPISVAAFPVRAPGDLLKTVMLVVLSEGTMDSAEAVTKLDPRTALINQEGMRKKNFISLWIRPDGFVSMNATFHEGMVQYVDSTKNTDGKGGLLAQSMEVNFSVNSADQIAAARTGPYERFTDEEMMAVRKQEQRKAATIGEYAAMVQLGYSSAEIKDAGNEAPVEDTRRILEAARAETVYLHSPADKHDTHIAVLSRCIQAIRLLPVGERPGKVYGCEIWRDLDWVPDSRKVALPVNGRKNLQSALNGVFDSQISGGKRYDLAVMGRRLAHATFFESHAADSETGLTFAIDLTPLCRDEAPPIETFIVDLIDEFSEDVRARIRRFTA